jgi:hypothetical protein
LAFDIRSQVEFFVHQTGDDHSLEKAQILRWVVDLILDAVL